MSALVSVESGISIRRCVWTLPVWRGIDKSRVDSSLSISAAYIFWDRSRSAIDKTDGLIVVELLWPNTRATSEGFSLYCVGKWWGLKDKALWCLEKVVFGSFVRTGVLICTIIGRKSFRFVIQFSLFEKFGIIAGNDHI